MPNKISVGPDGLLALTMPSRADGFYETFPQAGQIWLVDPTTGRVQTLLTGEENLSWATFSPDGNELLYVESPSIELQQIFSGKLSHPWRLMLFDRRSNSRTELLSGDHGFIWGPTFSPDGRKIAFYKFYHSHIGDYLNLHIFDRDSRQEKLLKTVQDKEGIYYAPYGPGPLWTPDGQGVFAFSIEKIFPEEALPSPEEITPETVRIFAGRLAVLSIDCRCEYSITKGFFPLLPVPLFLIASRDGRRLYVNGYDQTFSVSARERVNLYEISVETGERVVLYDGGGIALAPALSPHGERVLFTVISPDEPVKADLYLLDLTAAAPARKLTDDGRSGFGFWLSREEIGFLRLKEPGALRGEIWAKNLSTHEERNLSALVVQSALAQLSQETKAYEKSLEQVERQLAALHDTVTALSGAMASLSEKLGAVQTQSLEIANRTDQRLAELARDIGVLMADMDVVKAQLSGVETEVKAVGTRPALSLWQVAIALLITVVVIVWIIRRALHSLAQQIALPPQ